MVLPGLFSVLWPILRPIVVALLKAILPEIIDLIIADVKAGRPVVITDEYIDRAVESKQDLAYRVYRNRNRRNY